MIIVIHVEYFIQGYLAMFQDKFAQMKYFNPMQLSADKIRTFKMINSEYSGPANVNWVACNDCQTIYFVR